MLLPFPNTSGGRLWQLPHNLELGILLGLGNPCWQFGTSEQEPEMEPENMMVKLPSYILVPLHWFQATNRDFPNPAKSKFKVIVVVTKAFLWKDLGTRGTRVVSTLQSTYMVMSRQRSQGAMLDAIFVCSRVGDGLIAVIAMVTTSLIMTAEREKGDRVVWRGRQTGRQLGGDTQRKETASEGSPGFPQNDSPR